MSLRLRDKLTRPLVRTAMTTIQFPDDSKCWWTCNEESDNSYNSFNGQRHLGTSLSRLYGRWQFGGRRHLSFSKMND